MERWPVVADVLVALAGLRFLFGGQRAEEIGFGALLLVGALLWTVALVRRGYFDADQ